MSLASVKPKIAFILPTYGHYEYAHRAASSFFESTDLGTLIVIDDGFPDCPFRYTGSWFANMPRERIQVICREKNLGLTAGWNDGLRLARDLEIPYAIAGNSDVVFTSGWEHGLIRAVESGIDLVGPVTNAPGHLNRDRQNVRNFMADYQLRDDTEYLNYTSNYLRTHHYAKLAIRSSINGFFMFSSTELWWSGAFDASHVFDPRNRMTENDLELQHRWIQNKRKIGFVPSSFIFHYRSVTRGDKFLTPGWMRKSI